MLKFCGRTRWDEKIEDYITCQNELAEPHPCPFKSEIYDDEETMCTCCPDCAHECAMDI